MPEQPKRKWVGASGTEYLYYVYSLPYRFDPDQDGNYIYAKVSPQRDWVPIYIGEGELADRVSDNHHQAACIKRKDATHFHCHLNPNNEARRAEESDLLAQHTNAYQPSGCNEKPGG